MLNTQISAAVYQLQPSLIRKLANIAMGRKDIIPLWFGESDMVTPDFIREAAKVAIDNGETFYQPNAGIPALRDALSKYMNNLYGTGFDADNIIVTSSGMSAVSVAMQCVVSYGDKVVILSPVWPNLPSVPKILGANVVYVPLRSKEGRWSLDLDELFSACDEDTRVLCLNSPNNPTGWMLTDEEQDAILAYCRQHGIWLIADEVYNRVVYDRTFAPTFASKVTEDDLYLIVNSFSKTWAMTGWRLGWITAPKALKTSLEMLVEYNFSCLFAPIQLAGVAALEQGETFIKASISRYQTSRDVIIEAFARFSRVNLPVPDAAFYAFFSVDGVTDSFQFAQELLEKVGVGVAPGIAFGEDGESFLRICYAVDPERISEAVERMRLLLE